MTSLTRAALGAALSLALAACGKVSGQLPGATFPVGPAGGTIQLTDGASVQIPGSALSTTVNITMSQASGQQIFQPEGFVIVGPYYELMPHGQTFAVPVTLVLPYSTTTVGDKVQAVRIYMTQDGKKWEMATDTGHVQAGFVTGKTTHFSWAVAGLPGGTVPGDLDAGSWPDGVEGDAGSLPGLDVQVSVDAAGPDGLGGEDAGGPDASWKPDATGDGGSADGGTADGGGNPELSNGCTVSEKPGCVGCTCIGQVCNEIPSCCSEAWGEDCADLCADVGGCGGEKVCGDGVCSSGIETCKSCATDCGECPASCGDGTCNEGEYCDNCPTDCGECEPWCGDFACNGTETCKDCWEDCGMCPPKCGDHECNGNETCSTCEADCGKCAPTCGDSKCDAPGETCSNCEKDCGKCAPACGDGTCNGTETCSNCEKDCGKCAPKCGDAKCDAPGETCSNCKVDCGECAPVCGDGTCNGTETCTSCSKDCGACPTGKCTGYCGKQSPSGCYCDSGCVAAGDCCSDACATCGYCGGSSNKCVGYCGNKSPSGCYCDSGCVAAGDCCSDACATCGHCKSP
ncbi:MAG: hypothetical protein AMXMBFR64_57890 [Myxococcales bacterium]